jgi:hypothetical protein
MQFWLLTSLLGNLPRIDYLVRVGGEKLRLIEGDSEQFTSVLNLIEDYEGRSAL